MLLALGLFLATYVLLLIFPKIRAYIAFFSAGCFVVLGILPREKILAAVDWNVLMMIAGTMGTVSLFIESRMPARMADYIIERTPNVKWAIIALALFAGIISAFVDNVATVLIVAPIALTISKKLGISPVPGIIAIAVSSNLQGAATLVGDTTSILLGGYAGLDFLDFFVFRGKPGMFFVVEAGAIAAALVLLIVFRKQERPVSAQGKTEVEDLFPTYLLMATVLLLILASFIPQKPHITNGLICLSLMAMGVTRAAARKKDWRLAIRVLGDIDYFTLLLLGGLFVVIEGIKEAGVVDQIGQLFVSVSNNNLFVIYTLLTWASVLFSAFIDNIPYIATMLPVTASIAGIMGVDPIILYFGLLSGATLGGNLTPIGASANITAIGILRKAGHTVSAKEFMKISVPYTLAATVMGYVLIWLIWS
jgi:Na+/H+ antiporter NhaD/arsenite permease-like protein